jgi:choline dehydrogenase-like flavoprotein
VTIYSAPLAEMPEADVCIVGSGPVGIAMARALAKTGCRVTILESGGEKPKASTFTPTDEIHSGGRHAAASLSVCRAFGGTSAWWGGRCVPLDDIDFESRDYLREAAWPIKHAALSKWYSAAAQYFNCGAPNFTIGLDRVGELRFDELERWAPQTNMGLLYRDDLSTSRRIDVFLNSQVSDVLLSGDGTQVQGLLLVGDRQIVRARRYVLACGGLGTARLLLLLQREWRRHFGGEGGALGRYYMGHISGKIADLVLTNRSEAPSYDFFREGSAFARRRLTIPAPIQQREKLHNTAFWADNPFFYDAYHRNGVLSLVWLALAFPPVGKLLTSEGVRAAHLGPRPWPIFRHIANVAKNPKAIASDLSRIILDCIVRQPRKPGFLLRNAAGSYALHYHAEQAPNPSSRVRLSDRKDTFGIPQLDIDFQYRQEDVESVLRSHAVLDTNLRSANRGHLVYRSLAGQRGDHVWAQASDGFHQLGLTRMGHNAKNSVTDPNCRVHDLHNLYLASSGVFPSSGQATPTFAAVALGLRLADHLACAIRQALHISSKPASGAAPRAEGIR